MKRLIYIDTSEFVSANFNFDSERFKTVLARVDSGQIEVGMTEITKREILSKIDEALDSAEREVKKARSAARILRNLGDGLPEALFRDFDRADYQAKLHAQLEVFLARAKVEKLNIDMADSARVFDLYFSRMAPFGDAKKKDEFPDAFVLSVLSSWGEDEQREVLIASSDGDIREGVENFPWVKHAGTLEELLGRIAAELDQFVPAAKAALAALEKHIEQKLSDHFEGLGFVLSDQDGDVSDVRVTETSYDASLLHVEALGGNRGVASFDVVGRIHYEANLSYDDMESAFYDSEDKCYHVLDTVEESVDREEIFQATISITFWVDGKEEAEFELEWSSPVDVSVDSSAQDDYPYK